MNQKKFYRDLKFGVLKPKIFIILFCLFFSSLAFAAAPDKTWKDARIPSGISGCTSFQGFSLSNDRTEDPLDVIISEDGHTIFTVNQDMQSNLNLSMNKLRLANQLKTTKTAEKAAGTGSADCNDINGFNPKTYAGSTIGNDQYFDINISRDGKIFILLSGSLEVVRFDLTVPYDFKTATFTSEGPAAGTHEQSLSFSRDGMTMFSLQATDDTPVVRTFSLPSPFDITSRTETNSVNLTSRGYSLRDGLVENFQDIEFNRNGSEMFILSKSSTELNNQILQFSLGKNYDPATATYVGAYTLDFTLDPDHRSDELARPFGFAFSSDGMNLYYVQKKENGGVDRITHIELECSFGIASCSSDPTASIGSQVELSKQNISLNVSTIFKRFEWIKRNRNSNNLNNLNVSIKFDNPMLNYWVKKLPTKIVSINGPAENGQSITIGSENKNSNNLNNFTTTIKSDNPLLSSWMNKLPENIAVFKVSLKEKLGKYKKSNWSYWSLGDLSIYNYDKHGFENAKDIKSEGLTFGADRKFGDNKFLGLALRYGGNKSNISASQQKTDMESLTLNIYGIIPVNEDKYINAVVGLSALRFDNKYLDKLSGERNGKQAFTSINYRTKNTYGKFNITPTGKLTYGVTRLSKFTDFISNTIDSPSTNIIYAEDTFESGEFSAGFLFEMDKMEDEDGGTFQPMGGIEILYDLSPNNNYKFTYEGSTAVNKDTILGKYSRRSLKTEIGFEKVYLNGFTVSPIYERIISLNNDKGKNLYIERFIVKLSRTNEENNSEFVFNFNPIENNQTNLNYKKTINGYNVVVSSNYSSNNQIPEYGANIEVSNTF